MTGPLARYRALRAAGVLGINRRNAELVLPQNPRRNFPRVDDKLITKQLCERAGIPTPETYGLVSYHHELRFLPELLEGREEFVLKPARGSQGNGIVVIVAVEPRGYRKSSGVLLSYPRLRQHVSSILSGVFSLRGDADSCLIERRIVLHPAFEHVARFGIPDIRVIAYRGVPVMAMSRLPTAESDGRANLHQGAIGVGLDMAGGHAVHAALHNHSVREHPDTGHPLADISVPDWERLLVLAARCSEISGLGYVGVDLVIDGAHGPLVLELNARPGLAIQVCNNEGIAPRLREVERLPPSALGDAAERCAFARRAFARNPAFALLALALAALLALLPGRAAAAAAERWRVTIAARLAPVPTEGRPAADATAGDPAVARPIAARIALAPNLPGQSVSNVVTHARGLSASVHADDPHPHVRVAGKAKHPLRVGVSFDVERRKPDGAPGPFSPIEFPPPELVPFVAPAPLFQSRSILVRDFLESHAGPRLRPPQTDLVDAILAALEAEIRHRRDGKSLALDVVRRRRGKRIGIERVFTTSLRCAGIPARFVEGVDLQSTTKRKRVFWNLVFGAGRWWPVSASGGWRVEQPPSWVALALDGTRVAEGAAATGVTYTIQARKLAP